MVASSWSSLVAVPYRWTHSRLYHSVVGRRHFVEYVSCGTWSRAPWYRIWRDLCSVFRQIDPFELVM